MSYFVTSSSPFFTQSYFSVKVRLKRKENKEVRLVRQTFLRTFANDLTNIHQRMDDYHATNPNRQA